VSVLPLSLCQKLKPPVNLPVPTREVATYGNNTVKFHGPVPLHVQLCGITILHPFYIVDDSKAGLFLLYVSFYPRDSMEARVIWIATCLSVRLSSRAGIVSKKEKLAS